MKREKSCGALVYRYDDERLLLLLLRHRHGGHWSFPKGHMEGTETEIETALREVREETGLHVSLQQGFRHAVEYQPKPGVKKQVVYFLGKALPNEPAVRQELEISELKWVEWDEAFHCVTFKNDKDLLNMLKAHLNNTVR
ncbi:MAG: bis(5'-nucleosyl)-tetraphosphatase [Candidatus Fimivivens sp.]